jgi:hypothetical protein
LGPGDGVQVCGGRVARISEKLVERAREILKDESDSKSSGYIKGMKIES